jgi:hypothetical protein
MSTAAMPTGSFAWRHRPAVWISAFALIVAIVALSWLLMSSITHHGTPTGTQVSKNVPALKTAPPRDQQLSTPGPQDCFPRRVTRVEAC